MDKTFRNLKCFLLSLLFLSVSFFSCESARAAEGLGLDQLIQMALEKSPRLREAEEDVRSAESDLDQAKAGRWAQMDVIGITGPIDDAKEPVVVFDRAKGIGRLHDRDESAVGIFGRLDVTIMQPIFTFGKISHRKDAAAFGVAAQRSALEKKRGEVILSVKELYYSYIVANQGKGAAKDAGAFTRDARSRIERLLQLRARNVDQNDLYRLETIDADISRFKVKAESGAQLSKLALAKAVGLPPDQELRLDATELPKDPQPLGPQEEYVRQAFEKRPEFEQLKSGMEARKALLQASKADLYPSVFLLGIGSLAGAPGREEMDISYFGDDFNHAYFGVVLGTQWHFDLGISKAKVRKEEAEYHKLQHTKEYADRNIPLEVAKYYQEALEQQAGYQSYERAAIASRKWIISSFTNFDLGLGSARDMFDAIEAYGKNQGEYLKALYEYHIALANLSYATGEYR
jgi:outer membrane protein